VFDVDSQGGISYYLIDSEKCNVKELSTRCNVQPIFNTTETEHTEIIDVLYNNNIREIVNKVRSTPKLRCKNNTDNIYKVAITNCYSEKNCTNKSGTALVTISPYIQEHIEKKNDDTSFLDSFNSKESAESYISYLETKFIRFLFLMAKSSLHMQGEAAWRFIPDPGKFDHIFTDQELYKKYDLTPEEINIIESVIKERK
jgi:hypothetical protein